MKIILPKEIEIPDSDATVEFISELNNLLRVELESLDCRKKEMTFKPRSTVRTFPRNVIVRQPPNPPSVA